MNIEQQLEQLSRQTCPRQVDVVDAVMAEVRKHPYMMPTHRSQVRRRIALSAAAVAAAVLIVGAPLLFSRSYNEESISSMMASVQNYDYFDHVESAAMDPIEYLYEDDSEL